MKKIIGVLLMLVASHLAFAQDANKVLSDYIAIKNALVNGDSKAATQAATRLEQYLKEEKSFDQKDALLKSTEVVAKAGGLEQQRAAFNDLSVNIWKLVKNTAKLKDPVYYQYCPMKKAYWVNMEKDIKNPYYGSAMLTCGKVVETK